MHGGGVHFLDTMDAIGRHDEAIIGDLRKAAAIFAREGDSQHLLFPRRFESIDEIGGLAAGAEDHRDIVRRGLQAELVDVDPGEIEVVADRGHGNGDRPDRDIRARNRRTSRTASSKCWFDRKGALR